MFCILVYFCTLLPANLKVMCFSHLIQHFTKHLNPEEKEEKRSREGSSRRGSGGNRKGVKQKTFLFN
jgi:hypothetical protein